MTRATLTYANKRFELPVIVGTENEMAIAIRRRLTESWLITRPRQFPATF